MSRGAPENLAQLVAGPLAGQLELGEEIYQRH